MTKDSKYYSSVGRRKEASVRVRVIKGTGDSLVNGKPFAQYFPGKVSQILVDKPLKITGNDKKYYFTAVVDGGGKNAQLMALVLGISKALLKVDGENRPSLKKGGFLTRDARVRERRKAGTGGKARRKKQSPKR
jgi:small subunit ribosomal protein S9